MATNNEPELCYVLHRKPYRDNSLICELLSQCSGRVTALLHKPKMGDPFQLFQPILLQLKPSNSDLFFVQHSELVGTSITLTGNALYCGFYINELLVRLLKQVVDSQHIFAWYQAALQALAAEPMLEPVLRNFEMDLLEELGTGVDFFHQADSFEAISEQKDYYCLPGSGFVFTDDADPLRIAGADVLALANRQWHDPRIRKLGKQVMRQLIDFQLEGKPLKSRDLFSRKY